MSKTIEELRKKIYLHEKKEVLLTGRVASKKGNRRGTYLFEIKPLNPNDNNKEWVRLDDLYEIHHSQAPPTSEEFIAAVKRAAEKYRKENND